MFKNLSELANGGSTDSCDRFLIVRRCLAHHMLSAFGRADALAYPSTWSTPSSSCSCSVHLKGCTPTAVHLQKTFGSHQALQTCLRLDQPSATLQTPRRHRLGHPRTLRSSQPQRFHLPCRAAATSAEQQHFVFRSATSTEDLQQASVLRADAYYEVPLRLSHALRSNEPLDICISCFDTKQPSPNHRRCHNLILLYRSNLTCVMLTASSGSLLSNTCGC